MTSVVAYTRCKRYRITETQRGFNVQTKAWELGSGGPWFNLTTLHPTLRVARRVARLIVVSDPLRQELSPQRVRQAPSRSRRPREEEDFVWTTNR